MLITTCARMRPIGDSATRSTPPRPRCVAWHVVTDATEEITEADAELKKLVAVAAPHMLALPGVGP